MSFTGWICMELCIIKQKGWRILTRRKWCYFIILNITLWVALAGAIKYCDIPIWNCVQNSNIKLFFIKPDNADMLIYNLSVSYIASYIFYIVVNFIPDWLNSIEKEKELLSLRYAIHREIQVLTSNVVGLWVSFAKVASNSGAVNINVTNDIGCLFRKDVLQQVTSQIIFSDPANTYLRMEWHTKILLELNKISENGNAILTRYKEDIPTNLFYDLFYILNESSIVGILSSSIHAIALCEGTNLPLSTCIDFISESGKRNIEDSCLAITNTYSWVNEEYEYLNARIKGSKKNIFKIDVKNYL